MSAHVTPKNFICDSETFCPFAAALDYAVDNLKRRRARIEVLKIVSKGFGTVAVKVWYTIREIFLDEAALFCAFFNIFEVWDECIFWFVFHDDLLLYRDEVKLRDA